MKYPVPAGIFLILFSSLSFAQAQHPGVKYQQCLQKARAEAAAKIQAECTHLRGEGAISACSDRYATGEATISFCKLQSGILLPSGPNNLAEAKSAAEKQKSYEEKLGIKDGEFVGNAYNNPGGESLRDISMSKMSTHEGSPTILIDEDEENQTQGFKPREQVTSDKAIPVPTARPEIEKTGVKPVAQETKAKPKSETADSNRNANDAAKTPTRNSSSANSSATGSNRSGSATDDTGAAQAQASADIAQCEQAASAASRCCGNPMSCASAADRAFAQRVNAPPPASSEALPAYCQQMEALGDGSGEMNIRLGAICTNNHYACSNTCSSLESKYRALMASCENCDSYSIYASAAASLASRSSSCSRLSARADSLSSQGLSTASNSAYGAYCQSMAGAMPSAQGASGSNRLSGFSARDPYGCSANPNSPACVTCSLNPKAPGCAALMAAAAKGEAGFKTAEAKLKDFGAGDTSGVTQTGYVQPAARDANGNEVQQVPRVANNSGGGVPGVDGGQARLGPNGKPLPANGGARSYTTEVEQGYRSGGYSQPQQQAEVFPMSYGQQPTRQTAAADETSGYVGMDLKQYLPGGSRDPGRRLAGAAEQMQINAKEENIWRRISNKMYEKCKLGILWRCQ